MKRHWLAAMGAFVFVEACDASAGFETGESLYAECSLSPGDQRYYEAQANCSSYIAGVFDMIEMNANVKDDSVGKPKQHVCPPATVTKGQVVNVVMDFILLDSNLKQHSASVVVWMALSRAFPCKQ